MPRGISRYDEAQRQGRLWTPTVLRGLDILQSWQDGDDLSTIAYSSGVSTWADKSGRGRDLTEATNKPTLGTMLNARRGITCSITQRMGSASTWTLAQPLSIFTVWLQTYTSNVTNYLKGKNDSGYSGGCILQTNHVPTFNSIAMYAGAASQRAAPVIAASGVQYLHFGVYNGASSAYSLNGADRTTVAASIGTDGIVGGISLNAPSSNPWGGTSGEIIVLSGDTPLFIQRAIEGYLAWKWWGSENVLAASHPFKNRPPLIGD